MRALLPVLLLFSACGGESRLPEYELSGDALGTTFSIKIVNPTADFADDALAADVSTTIDRIDRLASTWRADSELSSLNASTTTDWITVSPGLCAAIESTLDVSRVSDGAFDVTVGPVVNLWGFGPDGHVANPPDPAALESAMQLVGYEGLETECDRPAVRKSVANLYVDLSGWAKGHAVDELALLLNAHGHPNYLVEVGGEIRVRGHNAAREKWAIAVEAPSVTERRPHSIVRITDTSVATSGDYRNFFEYDGQRYSHTIDPRTGWPVSHDLAAVTVISESAAYADAMATALLVMGPDAGPELASRLELAGYFLVRRDAGIEELTTAEFDALRY